MRRRLRLDHASATFITSAVLYGLFSFVLPINTESRLEHGLTAGNYEILILLIRLPIIIVLILIYYGFYVMRGYAKSIRDTKEGPHIRLISRGLGYLAWGLLACSFISAIINGFANANPSFRPEAAIIVNYLYIIVTVLSFSAISSGVHRLCRQSKVTLSTRGLKFLIAMLVAMGVLFCTLIASRLHGLSPGDSYNAYYLPNTVIWATVVFPNLYAWFIGILAAAELLLIAKSTKGIIYRRALQYVAIGIVLLIVSMVVLQYFRSIVPRTGKLAFGYTLGLTYAIYTLGAIGSLILARGARKLKRIEEI